MNLQLGDIVMRRNDANSLLFQVAEFDGDYVVLRGMGVSVFTISQPRFLIKINRQRQVNSSGLRRVK